MSAEASFVEILRDDGLLAACGESGRVIATPLYNYAMPLVRYEMGDVAEVGAALHLVGAACLICGASLALSQPVSLPNGRTIWPDLFNFHLREWIPLKQLQ